MNPSCTFIQHYSPSLTLYSPYPLSTRIPLPTHILHNPNLFHTLTLHSTHPTPDIHSSPTLLLILPTKTLTSLILTHTCSKLYLLCSTTPLTLPYLQPTPNPNSAPHPHPTIPSHQPHLTPHPSLCTGSFCGVYDHTFSFLITR